VACSFRAFVRSLVSQDPQSSQWMRAALLLGGLFLESSRVATSREPKQVCCCFHVYIFWGLGGSKFDHLDDGREVVTCDC
jgi:hypothetical protein